MAQKLRIFMGLLFVLLLAVLTAVAAGTGGTTPRPTPMLSAVQPATGQTGDVLTVSGIYLDAAYVRELYLTADGQDVKAEIVQQSGTAIRFRIPASVKPGRYCLTVLTTEEPPSLLEQHGASLTVTEAK